ncbi:hypothetical protein K438DRAFT_1996902 [Mycena galopus ATCC 62051]|nr:hypothetical protein K438DRAFT_1996902 [Mycena galopus ATCC 62051]
MSQTIPELEVPAPQSVLPATPEPERARFPAAWLVLRDKYVIEFSHWNKVSAPEIDPPPRTHFSVEWNRFYGTNFLMPWTYNVEIAGLVMRLNFGLLGCIIPVAYIPDYPEETFVFTIAGPCDAEGKKYFYVFSYGTPVSACELHRLQPAFSSVADFHLNRRSDQLVRVAALPNGPAETLAAFVKCGFEKVLERTVYEFSDSDSDSDG